jgi:uncharacterized membrane protein YbhN (UPF0104 family)
LIVNKNPPRNSPSISSRLWKYAKIALALALIGFILSQTNVHQLLSLREQMAFEWLWVYVIFYFILTAFKSYQYGKMLDEPIPYWRLVSIVVLQNGLSNIVANSAGIASYLVMFRSEEGVKVSRAAIVFIITKICDLLAVWLAMLVTCFMVWPQVKDLHEVAVILLILIGSPLFVFFLAVFLRQRFVSFMRSVAGWIHLTRFSWVRRGLEIMDEVVVEDRRSIFQMTVRGMTLSGIYFVLTLIWSYAQLRFFSVYLPLPPFIFITAILQLVSIIPITILGGLGVVETSSLYLYPIFGVDPVSFSAVLIGMRVLFYLINLVVLLYLPIYGFFENRQRKS